MAVQPGLCRTWSETPKTGFLTTRLIFEGSLSGEYLQIVKDYCVFLFYFSAGDRWREDKDKNAGRSDRDDQKIEGSKSL